MIEPDRIKSFLKEHTLDVPDEEIRSLVKLITQEEMGLLADNEAHHISAQQLEAAGIHLPVAINIFAQNGKTHIIMSISKTKKVPQAKKGAGTFKVAKAAIDLLSGEQLIAKTLYLPNEDRYNDLMKELKITDFVNKTDTLFCFFTGKRSRDAVEEEPTIEKATIYEKPFNQQLEDFLQELVTLQKTDLAAFVKKYAEIESIFRDVLKNLADCHARNIVHNDIKLENIKVNPHRLYDFGNAIVEKDLTGFQNDVFRLGMVFYNLYYKEPFYTVQRQKKAEGHMHDALLKATIEHIPADWPKPPPHITSLLEKMMRRNKPISAQEAYNSFKA